MLEELNNMNKRLSGYGMRIIRAYHGGYVLMTGDDSGQYFDVAQDAYDEALCIIAATA